MSKSIVSLLVLICKICFVVNQQSSSLCKLQIKNTSGGVESSKLIENLNNAFQTCDGSKCEQGYSLNCTGIYSNSKIVYNWSSAVLSQDKSNVFIVLNFNTTPCSNGTQVKQTSNVIVMCDASAESSIIRPIKNNGNACYATHIVQTKFLCEHIESPASGSQQKPPPATDTAGGAGVKPTSTTSHISGVGTFFLIVFLLASGYFLFGFLYKRYVLGAQGYEQVPHYLFWRRLVRGVQAAFSSGTQYQRPSPNDPSYRNYDDGDEFRYDQPPLMPDNNTTDAGGQNRFLSSRQPTQNAKDESDVRLLVV